MTDVTTASRAPLVLLANAQEWVSRSLESVLRPNGYTVLKAFNGQDALERAHRSRADAIILDSGLPESDVLTLTRALRVDPFVTPSTPILITFAGPLNRAYTLDALRAGANGVWGVPLDSEEFLLRLEAHLRAKLDADQARSDGLTDARTGLYNARGLERRARELAAHMDRQQGSLACVALAADGDAPALTESLGRTLRATARSSDAVGRLGPREFAVLAPDTDAEGAVQLFQRVAGPLKELGASPAPAGGASRPGAGHKGLRVRGGYDARSGFHTTSLDPAVLLGRALTALRVAEQSAPAEGGAILPFASRPTAH